MTSRNINLGSIERPGIPFVAGRIRAFIQSNADAPHSTKEP
ncbi:hypothetical protein C7S17_5311 [Burkholderia thailandensis]|nr:hypothetical protein [Burkholderia thailandensis]